jgi:hypothetical protein
MDIKRAGSQPSGKGSVRLVHGNSSHRPTPSADRSGSDQDSYRHTRSRIAHYST